MYMTQTKNFLLQDSQVSRYILLKSCKLKINQTIKIKSNEIKLFTEWIAVLMLNNYKYFGGLQKASTMVQWYILIKHWPKILYKTITHCQVFHCHALSGGDIQSKLILNTHNLNWEVSTGHQGGVKFKYLMQLSKTQICYVHMYNSAIELYVE